LYSNDSLNRELPESQNKPDKTPPELPPPASVPELPAPLPALEITSPPVTLELPSPPPSVPRTRWQRIWHWEYLGLVVIIVVTLGFHFSAIMRPTTIVWDEKWYVGDARSIITGFGDVRPEHPPLGKLFIVAGELIFNGFKVPEKDTGVITRRALNGESSDTKIYVSDASVFKLGMTIRIDKEHMNINGIDTGLNQITVERDVGGTSLYSHIQDQPVFVFTDNAFGWRFFSIIFGTLGIIVFYLICKKLGLSWKATMIATFLFAIDDMTFIHSGLALLDVYMVTFMLAAILLYLNENYLLCGVFVALSAECKLAGVLIIIAFFVHFLIYRKNKGYRFAASLVVAALSYVVFIVVFDYFLNGSLENPLTRISSMLSSTAANDFSVPKLSIASRPWTWLYPQFVQMYYNSPNVPFIVYSYDPQYISFISSTIQIFIVPTLGYLIYKAVKGSQTAGLLLLWFATTYILWIPLTLATNRVTFVFYFLPTTPAICIGLGMAISDIMGWLKSKRERAGRTSNGVKAWYGLICFYFLLHFAIFIVFNPAIPTIIKTWLPPFTIGVDPTAATQSLNILVNLFR
jgi:dolichyl-phosphate-mannose-protein mannosyltransferase